MTYIADKDFFTLVSQGLVPNHTRRNKSGLNQDIDAGTPEDIWDGGGTWVEPTASRIHALVSTSANDTAAGTGARTVFVSGVSGGNLVTETVTLNGTTPVNTVNSYTIIDYMLIATAGSGGTNAGVITATAAVDATITAQINADATNQTQMAIMQVPTGYSYYMYNWSAEMYNANASSSADVGLYTKTSGGVWALRRIAFLSNSGDSNKKEEFIPPLVIPAGAFIKIRCTNVTNSNTKVDGYFNGILIAD